MPFGLCNAAQTFQRLMNVALRGLDYCYCYVDDILVASKTPNEHKQHLREVLQRLREHGLKINVKNVRSAQTKFATLDIQSTNKARDPCLTE